MRRLWAAGLLLAIGTVLAEGAAWATPAFARREGFSCQVCHYRVPELNPNGVAYARRGLRSDPGVTAGQETARPAETPRALGMPLTLQWANYLAVLGHESFNVRTHSRSLFDAGGVELWLGGPFDTRWSAFVVPAFDAENGTSSVGEAYGQFISRWAETFGSARFGQVLPSAILFNQGGPSMTLSTPLVLSTPADTGTSWTPATLVRGLELGGVGTRAWNVYAGVGQPHLEDPLPLMGGMDPNTNRDTDLFASAERTFNSAGDSLTAYGYWGHGFVQVPTSAPVVQSEKPFHRFGFFGNAYFGDTKGVVGWLTGSDDIPGATLDTSGYFVLLEQRLSENWAGYLRFDGFSQDLSAGGSQRINGPTIGLTWWPVTEIRLTAEAQFLKMTGAPQANSLGTQLDWWF